VRSKAVISFIVLFVATGTLLMNGCSKDKLDLTPINFTVPPGFPQPAYDFTSHPLTEEGFQLGKKLFFDGRLSADGHFACGSCHQPVAAFTTFEHDRSHGYNNAHTLRNAPGLFNLAWLPEYNQDGSAKTLEEVYRNHITNAKEMAETIPNVLNKLKADDDYKRMFRAAFGDEKITEDRMYRALTQFVLNLVSANSKYDKVKRGEATFSAEEQQGYTVFQAKCATCHKEPLFTDFSYRNNGLEPDISLNDHGRMRVTGNAADDLKFRVPTLRNAELTSYYGHDGRLSVFRMMIQHYRNGIVQSPTLDPLLINGIQTTATEENAVVAFLRTLSDSAFLNNPRFRE
jgi:cytochrome c peroxidase